MSFIPQSFVDDLLERSDIVDLIDSRVKLKKAGKDYLACCPFHDEKTPSFTVSRDKQFFHCFGCGANGNAISFIMDYDRLTFPEAIESLAKTIGVEVPREGSAQQQSQQKVHEKTRKSLYRIMESVKNYYQQQLKQHNQRKIAINYLKRRGLNSEIVRNFGIGFAPPGFDNLANTLDTTHGENQSLLLEAGMLIENQQQGFYDRFRHRIMFPIRDTRGRVIAFGGRVLGNDKPKYLNSPETRLFQKNKTLYGLYEARQSCHQLKRLIVVEGYMDVVSLAQFGIHYAVATLGTACGSQHLQQAFQFVSEIVFCFDGDRAGRQAARRAMENTLPIMEDGRQVKFLYLPEGEDPDTLIRQVGVEKFSHLIDQSSPLESVLFDELSHDLDIQTMEGRARLSKLAAPLLNQLPRGVYRELCFAQLAKRTQLSMDTLMALLNELPQSGYPAEISAVKLTSQTNVHIENESRITAPSSQLSSSLTTEKTMLLSPGDLAVVLLLYQPKLAQSITDIDELKDSQDASVKLLLKLIALLKQHPEFSSGQILGHWQGAYGAEATARLQILMSKMALFHRARELSTVDLLNPFNPLQEFTDVLDYLKKHLKQEDCDTIVRKLNQKPFSEWTNEDKQRYREATKNLNH